MSSRLEALTKQAIQAHKSGKTTEALGLYRRALAKSPKNPDLLLFASSAALSAGQPALAVGWLKRAVAMRPDEISLHLNLGKSLKQNGQYREAIKVFEQVLRSQPNNGQALYSLASLRNQQGETERAIELLYQALQSDRPGVRAHVVLSGMLIKRGDLVAAKSVLEEALARKPNHSDCLYHLGLALRRSGDLAAAADAYRKAFDANPKNEPALASVLEVGRDLCQWEDREVLETNLDRLTDQDVTQGRQPVEAPFAHLYRSDDAGRNFALARSWSDAITLIADGRAGNDVRPPKQSLPAKPADKRRIGYFCAQFYDHPVMRCASAFMAHHDHEAFAVFGYGFGKTDDSRTRKRALAACDAFVDLSSMTDAEAAERIAEDRIDVLVDLTGYSDDNRIAILANRPARVQTSYLGHLGTTGSNFMDAVIGDETLFPPHARETYTESFAHLPHCFISQPPEYRSLDALVAREEFGLPDGKFIFCSFNAVKKINPRTFDAWCAILNQVPDSVLWIYAPEQARSNLSREAMARGIDDKRLVFANPATSFIHKARLQLADLALDTTVYSGGVTTAELLWAGVPVLTLPGRSAVSRMSASILMASGLDDLVVDSWEAYHETAVEIATDPDRHRALRLRVANARNTSPVFDPKRFCRSFEAVLTDLVARATPDSPRG